MRDHSSRRSNLHRTFNDPRVLHEHYFGQIVLHRRREQARRKNVVGTSPNHDPSADSVLGEDQDFHPQSLQGKRQLRRRHFQLGEARLRTRRENTTKRAAVSGGAKEYHYGDTSEKRLIW